MFRIIPHRLLAEPRAEVAAIVTREGAASATLRIEGLVCSLCATSVERRLRKVAGVRTARVDLGRGEAQVTYAPSRVTPAALTVAVERAVVLRPARRLLAALGGRLARSDH